MLIDKTTPITLKVSAQALLKSVCLVFIALLLGACSGRQVPEGISPVSNFEQNKYIGKWYEIARYDHRFERGLQQVTANYSMQEDGGIKVVNQGFDEENMELTEAIGRAYFVGEPNKGHLKVSFFGPFFASYVVFDLDKENYQWALVTGPSRNYFWILSRTPTISDHLKNTLLDKAEKAGFQISKMIFVKQSTS